MSLTALLQQRRRQPEIMDQPELDRQRHFQALRGLGRINRFSGSTRILWRPLQALARAVHPRPLSVLDVATGGGDGPIALWRRACRAGLSLQMEGCDMSACALEYARQQAEKQQAAVRFFVLDVLAQDIPSGYDVLTCSLFLHHLDEEQAASLLRRMAGAAGLGILVHDLVRGVRGYLLAALGTRLLSRSDVVHTDGLLSVQGAFTLQEVRDLADRAGLSGATVEKRWPCRLLLSWRRQQSSVSLA